MNIEVVWNRIINHEGDVFSQIRGQEFTYVVRGASIIPSTTKQYLAKSHFEKALEFLPLKSTKQVQHLRGPSYIYAILMDHRIRQTDW